MSAAPKRITPYGFDPVFERAVVTLCCTNTRFYGRVGHELDPELFKYEASKFAMRACHAIAKDVGHGPSTGTVVIQRLRRWMDDGKATLEIVKKVCELLDDAEDAGLPEADQIIAELAPVIAQRIRDQAVQSAIESFGRKGDLSKAVQLEERASRIGVVDTSVGTLLGTDSWQELSELRNLERLKTGVPELDGVLDGGLQRQGLGIVVGGPGDGKSMMLSHIGAVNLLDGLFVGYATLELPRPLVLARTKANLTSMPINALVNEDSKEAQRRLQQLSSGLGKFVVQDFTAYATTIEDIKDWVARCEDTYGKKMDLLIVDYGDKLGVKKQKDEDSGYTSGRIVFEGLRIYSVERKMFVWTASQATRQKDKRKRLDLNDVADSMHKVRVADLVVTLNLKEQDGADPEVTFYVAKHRTGKSRVEVGPFPAAYELGQVVAL